MSAALYATAVLKSVVAEKGLESAATLAFLPVVVQKRVEAVAAPSDNVPI